MTIEQYIDNINQRYTLGNATEHTFRGDLQQLLESLVPEVHEDEEITDVHLEEEAEEVPTVTTLDNGRVQLRIPL